MHFLNTLTPQPYHTQVEVRTIDDGPGDDVRFVFAVVEGYSGYQATFSLEDIVEIVKAKHQARQQFLLGEELKEQLRQEGLRRFV